jgi:hypothetical protein
MDNNLSVRIVGAVVIGRKNYLFLGSDNGGKAATILYSMMARAKAGGTPRVDCSERGGPVPVATKFIGELRHNILSKV